MKFSDFSRSYKYAQTFLRIAYPEPGTAPIDTYKKLSYFFKANPGIIGLIANCPCPEQCVEELESFLVRKFELTKTEKKLIRLLLQNHSIMLLPSIMNQLIEIEQERRGELACTVETSHEINNKSLEKLLSFFEKQTNKKILPTIMINPKLICGLRIYSETKLYDYSIKKILTTVKDKLTQNGEL